MGPDSECVAVDEEIVHGILINPMSSTSRRVADLQPFVELRVGEFNRLVGNASSAYLGCRVGRVFAWCRWHDGRRRENKKKGKLSFSCQLDGDLSRVVPRTLDTPLKVPASEETPSRGCAIVLHKKKGNAAGSRQRGKKSEHDQCGEEQNIKPAARWIPLASLVLKVRQVNAAADAAVKTRPTNGLAR